MEGGNGLRAMEAQLEMDLRCDEELDELCNNPTQLKALLSRTKVAFDAYHRKIQELELQIQRLTGEREVWDRSQYYRQ